MVRIFLLRTLYEMPKYWSWRCLCIEAVLIIVSIIVCSIRGEFWSDVGRVVTGRAAFLRDARQARRSHMAQSNRHTRPAVAARHIRRPRLSGRAYAPRRQRSPAVDPRSQPFQPTEGPFHLRQPSDTACRQIRRCMR